MFARRTYAMAAAAPAPSGAVLRIAEVFKRKPAAGAAAAAALFLTTGVALIALAGDPDAGAPSVTVSLKPPAEPVAAAGWKQALGPELPTGAAPVTLDTLQLSENAPLSGMAVPNPSLPVSGQAVITLPAGATMSQDGSAMPVVRGFAASPLAAAPLPGLFQQGPNGPLPVIGPDGRTPAQAYARPFRDTGKPKVAVVIGGLGLNAASTKAAIEQLPPEITLSFVARAAGHEVLLEAPMEPVDYPDNDPGPYTLLADAKPEETTKRLEWLLSRATGYFGVTNYLGGKFLTSDTAVTPLAQALKARGVAFFDDGTGRGRGGLPGLTRASADRILDDQLSASAIDRELLGIEAAALQRGGALASGFAYPVTIQQVAKWAESVPSRGYVLAPASAVANR